MSGSIAVDAAQNQRELIAFWVAIGGLVLLAIYTVATLWQVALTRKAIRDAQEGSTAALEETRKSNAAVEKSNTIAERTLMLSKRAWLLPEIGDAPLSSNGRYFVIRLINAGNVPCLTRRFGVHAMVFDALPDRLEFPEEMYKLNGGIVPPTAAAKSSHNLGAELPDIAGWEERANILLVYCRIEYTDVFEKPWETVACWARERGSARWYVIGQLSSVS